MSTSNQLLGLAEQALRAGSATDAGARVFRPGDWPTQQDQYPVLKIRVARETKQSLGRSGPPQFTVTTTIRVVAEVSAPAQVGDAGAVAAEAALWRLVHQVEAAIINSYPLTAQIQQILSIDSQLSYTSEAETHLAGAQIDLALEHYQDAEDFAAVVSDDVDAVAVTWPAYGIAAEVDLTA